MIAVIPARGGSKGVPHKNIKCLINEPLISYTIKAAIESEIFEKVVVSTDDLKIKKVAESCGAEVPFVRPTELARDNSSSDDVILHLLNWYKENGQSFDMVCKLQATSPLRKAHHIVEAFDLFKKSNSDFLVSICECEHSPLWSGVVGADNRLDNFISDEVKRANRQELPTYYRLNGAIYMAKTDCFVSNKSFIGKNSTGYIMSQRDSVDIDSELDFKLARLIMEEENIG